MIASSPSSSKPQSGEAESKRVSESDTRSMDGIEVTWEVPGEPVDGFVIRYGQVRGELSKEIKVSSEDLQQESDPEYGPVYRYLIRNVAPTAPLFISIAAYKGDRISNFSEVLAER
jgi:hypothetical protein